MFDGRLALRAALGVVVLLASALVPGRTESPDLGTGGTHWFPGFAVEADGETLARPPGVHRGDVLRISAPAADVALRRLGAERWELRVAARRRATRVWFPWRTRVSPLDLGSPRTVILYPALLGLAARATHAASLGFDRRVYPGEVFAPLLVASDARVAEIVAAVNWPPRTVTPVFDPRGLALRYDEPIAAGRARAFRALVARRDGDEAQGRAPWLRAAYAYRAWLVPRLARAGLSPSRVPRWLAEAEGWQNVQLQNVPDLAPGALEERWRRWKDLLPWMQLWGQMSGYAGGGDARLPGADAGCCVARSTLHPRYAASVVAEIARIAEQGRVGLYARPRAPYAPLVGGSAADRRFLLGWLRQNRERYGANAFYVDVLGHRWFGEPLDVARLVRDRLPAGTVIEYAVDVYPRPALVSGALAGGSFGGGPGREPRDVGGLAVARTTFPRFGRAVLADALLFLGESNGDHALWGVAGDHWAERQAFLLGAKLDAMRPWSAADRGSPNEAVARIVALRRAVGWWARRPVYLDRAGLSELPADVDVRRFRGASGEDLLVVDNWSRRAGAWIRLDGRAIALSAEPLSVHVVGREA